MLGTDSDKSIAAVAQSTSTAATTILQVEQEVLPANQIVTIRSGQNGRLLRVMGNNFIRFGDTISVRLTCKRKTKKENREGQIPQGVVEWDVEVKNQRGETVATETVLTLVQRKDETQV